MRFVTDQKCHLTKRGLGTQVIGKPQMAMLCKTAIGYKLPRRGDIMPRRKRRLIEILSDYPIVSCLVLFQVWRQIIYRGNPH